MSKTRRAELLAENRELQKTKFDTMVDVEREKRFGEELEQFLVKNELLLEDYSKLADELMDSLGKWRRHSEELLNGLKQALEVGNALMQQNKRLMAMKISKIKLKL